MKFRDPDWLTVAEAAEIMGVAVSTMRRYGDTGRIEGMNRLPSGIRQFPRAEIEKRSK